MTKRELARSGIFSALTFAALIAVLGMTGCGSGSESESRAGTTQDTASTTLDAKGTDPIELSATAESSAEIDLAWSPGPDDGSSITYRISRNGVQIATLEDVSAFEDTGLSPSTTYSYTVEIIDTAGNVAGRSNEAVAATTAVDPTPPLVSAISTEDGEPLAVNSAITMDFSASMSKSTLNANTFKVETRHGTQVQGSVSVQGSTATFTPSAELSADTEHTATISASATDVAGNALATPFAATFATAAVADTTPPKVWLTVPAHTAVGIARNTAVSATFSEPMKNSSLTTANFKVVRTSSGTAVAGIVTVTGNTATFTPSTSLSSNTKYTVSLSKGVTDAAGIPLAASFAWTFTTGSTTDTTPPQIVSKNPITNATGVALNTSISAKFSEPMRNSTLTTASFKLARASAAVAGKVTVSGNTATFTPSAALAGSTQYTASITTAAKDAAGNPLTASYSWTFTTAGTIDTTRPTVSATSPKQLATGVAANASISATFSEPMKASTLTAASVKLARTSDGASVTGTVSTSGNTVTFDPSAALAGNTQYTATITTAAKDAAGNSLASNHTWIFTTATATATTTAVLDWDPVSVTTLGGYRIYYGTAPGTYLQPSGQGLNVGKVTTYTITGLGSGKRYYFAVTAFDSSNRESARSNEVFKDIP